jgi:hypothetical protein
VPSVCFTLELLVTSSEDEEARLILSETSGFLEALLSIVSREDHHVIDAEKLLLALIS